MNFPPEKYLLKTAIQRSGRDISSFVHHPISDSILLLSCSLAPTMPPKEFQNVFSKADMHFESQRVAQRLLSLPTLLCAFNEPRFWISI